MHQSELSEATIVVLPHVFALLVPLAD
jgi:hypothetical protein